MRYLFSIITSIIFFSTMQAQITISKIDENTSNIQVGELVFPVFDQGKGTPVLLLHGFPDSRYLWRHQIPVLLDAGYRVIVPDMKGFGSASKPQDVESYAIPVLVQELMGIMDSLKIDQFYLIGHDWGAAISWFMAAFHPQRVQKLIALSVGCNFLKSSVKITAIRTVILIICHKKVH